ncbi:Cytochrome c biogenesis ATP-binding export protein CcmA [Rickettsiales bacterium Ac37b]|nr:Cytochrome c biogenesis ATP-binding export protein CcmA [Rickettsiales bacterium Ac37b]
MLSCSNITVESNYNVLFKDLGFSLLPGSLLILRGNNGSGKTTLLKLIAGIIKPTKGTVSIEHHNEYKLINYIAHKNALRTELSVIDNLIFWSELYQTPELILPALMYFGLDDIKDISCCRLSAGWQKKVALARLIACHSYIWLLDEPENNLDNSSKELLYTLIDTRVRQGGIVIIASHNNYPIPYNRELFLEDFNPNNDNVESGLISNSQKF